MDEHDAVRLIDIRRNGETAIPRDARANTADEFLYEAEVVRKDECCHKTEGGLLLACQPPSQLFLLIFKNKRKFLTINF